MTNQVQQPTALEIIFVGLVWVGRGAVIEMLGAVTGFLDYVLGQERQITVQSKVSAMTG